MYDLLPMSWARTGVRMRRCTSCCRCPRFKAVPECSNVRLVAGVLGSKRGPNAKMYKLLPVSWARSGVRMLRCTICCRCIELEAATMYDWLPVSWARSGFRMLRCTSCCRWARTGRMVSRSGFRMLRCTILLPVSWARSGVRMLRCTSCCRCLGLEAGSEC